MIDDLFHARWPEADQAMWAALCAPAGPFDEPGALAHLRESSVSSLAVRYDRWIRWLRDQDPAALDEPPSRRATLPRLKRWLDALVDNAPMSRLMFIDGLLRVLTAADPQADWSRHRRLKANLKRAAGRGNRARKAGRVLSSRVLLQAGVRHASEGAAVASTPLRRATCQRDGALVAFLAMMPIRCRALAGLTLGQSILVTPERLTVVLHETLTKTGLPWEAEVPEPAAGLLREYIDETRPFLMTRWQRHHDILWVGDDGRPFNTHYLGIKIGWITEQLTGTRVPAHLFRDAAATTLARESPEAARLMRPVLAHTGFETAERHYNHARSIEAGRDYAAVLRGLKEK